MGLLPPGCSRIGPAARGHWPFDIPHFTFHCASVNRWRGLLVVSLLALVPSWLSAPPRLHAQAPGDGSGQPRAASSAVAPAAPPGADSITQPQLRGYLTFIASDLLEGRDTPSRGLDIAAAFLALQLSRLGLQPAGGNGTFLQTIALTQRRVDVERTHLNIGNQALVFGDDFLPGTTPGTAEGPLVYVGHGYVIKSRGIDPTRTPTSAAGSSWRILACRRT